MTAVRCRAATRDDADAIADLHAASWRATYRGSMRDAYLDGDVAGERRALWRERLGAPSASQHVVVAEDAGEVLGFACAYGAADPTWGTELDNLHVGRAAQSRGIGARLLRATARWARAAHADAGLYLWVVDRNTGARRFYERHGARDAGGDHWQAPDGSAIPVRRCVWAPDACATLAAGTEVLVTEPAKPEEFAVARALFE